MIYAHARDGNYKVNRLTYVEISCNSLLESYLLSLTLITLSSLVLLPIEASQAVRPVSHLRPTDLSVRLLRLFCPQ